MKGALLLWLLVLHAWIKPSESRSHDFEDVKDYEVVRPVRLHSVRRRHVEHLRPETVRYAMTLGGRDIEMRLKRNHELLTKDYTETYYQEDGTRVTAAPNDVDHCYYHGSIVNDSQSSLSISTCDGLRGYFRTSAQRYLIEPLSGGDEGDHAVMTFEEKKSTPAVCGVTNTSWSDDYESPTGQSRSRAAGISIVQKQKYVELFIVADNRAYLKMDRDQTRLRKRIFEIVNFVNMAYKPMRTFIALVGLEMWSNRDMFTVTPPAGANLNAFMMWRNSELLSRKQHDNAQFISGIDFEGATVGLAYIGTLCSGHSVGVTQDHNDRAVAVGATMAHEMGHNLGMNHDDSSGCACSADSCIMAAALSWNIPRTFSSCSGNDYQKYLLGRNPDCMLNKPDYRDLQAPSFCGNGFLEKGEQCDCGSEMECTNPCCNATDCTLKEGAQCAEGECCEDCKVGPRSIECRPRRDECDLAEYCDGHSANCPEDVFAVNGLPCAADLGYCYNGLCPRRVDQCVKMYGAGSTEGGSFCYHQNTRGTYFAFCRRPEKENYIPCQERDVLCGKLFCHGGKSSPNYGRMVTVRNCKASFYEDHTKDYGQVDAGTKCGDGKVCSQNECVQLETAFRNVNCSAKCRGHAVCNHKSECQCEPGWVPPQCDNKNGDFGSLSPGAISAIVVTITLVALGVVAGAAAVIRKRRQTPALPTVDTQRKQLVVDPSPSRVVPVKARVLKPKRGPPPPPPAGNRPKPPVQNYTTARQALRPVPPPRV
ncbi:zinc metalloproteinase-disintegrin-like MTP4 isoform 2-T2 [Spinachia spinachia]